MTKNKLYSLMRCLLATGIIAVSMTAQAEIEGSLDPTSVVEQWSNASTYPKVIDINFSDEMWPGQTWTGQTGKDCPEYADGAYVNAVLRVPANGGNGVTYPVLFHNCTFANKKSYNGYAGATAAFCRQYYLGESATGNSTTTKNNWTVAGHTNYLEDNIQYDANNTPIYGEAGFVQFCRNQAITDETTQTQVSAHGWMEIDHIPYVERVQWSWSSTSWGRGIKCDIKIGDGEWKPLVWMGSDKQKSGYTVFSDQGYFMENVIDANDVSLRWRVWDGDDNTTLVQTTPEGTSPFDVAIDPMAMHQTSRVHKIQIFGNDITAEQAQYATENPVGDVGKLSDLNNGSDEPGNDNPEESAPYGLQAFPTAQGFGMYATGGRGGKVVTVTSLDDDAGKEGTLRWAFAQYPGEPLTVVFAVSGEIQLSEPLSVKRADWTLAGQTAPGEGILISRNKVNFGGSQNFIVRNVRFRSGAKNIAGVVLEDQACGVENCTNFIFDHCVFGWSVEENMNTQDSHFLTVQYSMVHEGLYNAGHSKGARGYGSQWGGSPATYHHNLLAHNKSRSPRFNGARGDDYVVFMEYANNVNYNFGASGVYGGENTADINQYNGKNSVHECNVMNNYYKPGKIASASDCKFLVSSYAREGATSWAPAKWYVNGNVMEDNATATADNWKAVGVETYTLDDIRVNERIVTATPYNKYSIDGGRGCYLPERYMLENIATAEEAYNDVVNHAGTINRDKVEQRIANEVLTGTCQYGGATTGAGKGIIDTENDAEGFYAYSTEYTTPVDTDGDGMPDEWESNNGLNPQEADQNRMNIDGYTALEVYLCELMGESMSKDFSTGIHSVQLALPELRYDSSAGTLEVGKEAVGGNLSIYTTDGHLLRQLTITSTKLHLGTLPKTPLLLQIEGRNIRPRVLKLI
ncbi:MAG: polysaccharide lyase family 1 protein [Prevotella sp.]